VANDLKLKGPVREIGIARDSDRHDSFNITIGIAIKTEGKVSYEEAERLSSKFRREFLGKDVEFVSVSIPCPVCGRVLNSESGLKKHVAMNHPDKVDLVNPLKVAAKNEKLEKKTQTNRSKTSPKQITKQRTKTRMVKTKKTNQTTKVEKLKPVKKQRKTTKAEAPSQREPNSKIVKPAVKTSRMPAKAEQPKTKQLKLT
jgi:hypothetical protein